ncbi:PX-associated-domain-containing protein [Podospora australis]|uniref:PX-associated-domain-containing protein n=1 Tax=Podospora australis TaxID=1536484 RepID=A0AAN7AI31_9PEZI|nr:PX-associated-domain-containing protein [Podospora australis]
MEQDPHNEDAKIPKRMTSISQPKLKLTPAPGPPDTLSSFQLHALFDILTHEETYAEVESFKDPITISGYGYPFASHGPDGTPTYPRESSTPLLAGVLRSIVLPFPGVRDLPPEFWHVRFQGILENLAEAELSESYDQGSLGTRKTLATAASSIHESVSRGILGGVEKGAKRDLNRKYDLSQARDLVSVWEDGVHELLYGDLIDELFKCAAERQSLEEHSPGVQAAAEYTIIHIATLLHHIFVLSPEGPYLLKLLESVHRLLPYSMIKQTLRIGNAATMINGMMKLLLAKIGVGALSNWVGLTQGADDGMNLLQRIIWMILSWEISEYRKAVDKIERTRGDSAPSKEQLSAIREYINKPRQDHENARKESARTATSMVTVILTASNPELTASITEAQHAQCVEYFSTLLHIRDREEIQNALCRQNPDLFTQAIRDFVASFENIIRVIHEKVDLREHVSAGEGFLTDFINVGKAKKATSKGSSGWGNGISRGAETESQTPSIEDYVMLLRRNKQLLYNWLHQLASQCPDLAEDFRVWAKATAKIFQQNRRSPPDPVLSDVINDRKSTKPKNYSQKRKGAAGALSSNLQHLFSSLPAETRETLARIIDAHADYLSSLEDLSLGRMQNILDNLSAYDDRPPSSSAPSSGWSTTFGLGGWSSSGKSSTVSAPATQGMSFAGPGMFLFRWQQLLDNTIMAPATVDGKLRSGKDIKAELAKGNTDGATSPSLLEPAVLTRMAEEKAPKAPDVRPVVEALGKGFKELARDILREDERFAIISLDEKLHKKKHSDKVAV